MSEKDMGSSQKPKKRDPDLVAAEIAIKRAAAKARQKAKQVGTGVVVWKDGSVVQEGQNT
jgi:tRNA(Arg) A34 adenosine deaminase TadA